jgi:hypothetical protein
MCFGGKMVVAAAASSNGATVGSTDWLECSLQYCNRPLWLAGKTCAQKQSGGKGKSKKKGQTEKLGRVQLR